MTQTVADIAAGQDHASLNELADHHWRQGVFHARAAYNNSSWYHNHAQDTAKAANHFAVAASLRHHLTTGDQHEAA